MSEIQSLLTFIDQSPTAFHAVAKAAQMLEENGFVHLFEGDAWNLEAGRGYYVTRNQSSVIAFRMPENIPERFMMVATHTDSRRFKLKNESIAPAFDR